MALIDLSKSILSSHLKNEEHTILHDVLHRSLNIFDLAQRLYVNKTNANFNVESRALVSQKSSGVVTTCVNDF